MASLRSRAQDIDWKAELKEADRLGETGAETADRLNVGQPYVSMARSVLGMNVRRGPKVDQEELKEIVRLRNKGMSYADIARELGDTITHSTVRSRYLVHIERKSLGLL